MKKILLGMLFFIFLTSCGNSSEKTVSKFIDNLKAGKTSEAGKYTTDENFEKNFKQTYDNQSQELLFKSLLKNINYKIVKSEKQSEDTSIVTVEVENIDTKKFFLQFFKNISSNTFSKTSPKKTSEEILKETLEDKDLPKAKNTTKFMVKKSSDTEKIALTGENLEVLLGKINTTFSNLDTILPKDENSESDND
ncbi:hypothetical protein [Leptotrichia sp. oral taxon 847]|uniref:hypothetical protein n=1 Tax=Leptotrichia sp. oral taxon 847 TaxID=1785996 RepID=UPI0007680AFC|nr:hypothetical protein [Leptotrichia sp. oral taxon 847]AMD94807.1 hypothetical protein AXF11_03850 [Leptotrichia sp. oral taxon 847]